MDDSDRAESAPVTAESAVPESAPGGIEALLHRRGNAAVFVGEVARPESAPVTGEHAGAESAPVLAAESGPAAAALLWRNKRALIEALIFASEEPVSIPRLVDVVGGSKAEVRQMVDELRDAYDRFHGLTVIEVAGGFRITGRPEFAEAIRRIYGKHKQLRLTAPSLETLAIIAYKQPVTRAEVEQLRGVATDGVVRTLLERGLIKIVGRKEELGRPFLFGTTRAFLEYFGLQSLRDLPDAGELDRMVGNINERETEQYVEGDPNADRPPLRLSDEELRGLWRGGESGPVGESAPVPGPGESSPGVITEVQGDEAFESALADLTWDGDPEELAESAAAALPADDEPPAGT